MSNWAPLGILSWNVKSKGRKAHGAGFSRNKILSETFVTAIFETA
jgi:hypothetical protein